MLALALQPDGKIVIGGSFSRVRGFGRGRIARINADGFLDDSFASSVGWTDLLYDSGAAAALAVQPDGRILTGSGCSRYNGGGIDPALA